MKTRILFLLIFIGFSINLFAQNSGFQTDPIKVVRSYEAILSDALKLTPVPSLPTLESEKREFTYQSLRKVAPTNVMVMPMTPMRAMAEPPSPIANNYFKAGFGNYTTPLLKAHYMSKRDAKFEYGINLSHFSSRGDLRVDTFKFDNADLSDNSLGVYGKRYLKNIVISSNFDFERNVRHFYGFHQATEVPKDSIRQVFNQFSGSIGVNSYHVANDQLDFSTKFSFYTLGDRFDQSENNLRLDGAVLARLNENKVTFDFAVDYTNYTTTGGLSINRNLIYFQPRYEYLGSGFRVQGGFNMAMQAESGISVFQFYPVIDAEYRIADVYMIVYGGITGNIERNSFRDIVRRNPFVGTQLDIRNTNNRFQLYGGLKGSIDEVTTYDLNVGFQRMKDALFFLNDSSDFTRLTPVYDSLASVFNFKAKLDRRFGEKYSARLNVEYNGYKLSTLASPFMQPTFIASIGGSYNLQKRLSVTTDIYVFNGVDYLTKMGKIERLNGVFDMSVGANYTYNNRASIFLQINNLTASRYFRWFNYTSYGINLLGGVTFQL